MFNKIKTKKYFKPLIILIAIALIVPIGYTVSRYVMNVLKDYYIESKNFYFNSNRLKEDNPMYLINNWSGVGTFTIDISLNSNKNHILASDFDVSYNLSYTCSQDVICSSDKNSGVIYTATHTDNVIISITPTRAFDDGESVIINVSATSTSPYVETISADFKIVVGKRGIAYTIDDQADRPYLLVSITNAIAEYNVIEAFGGYLVGDKIDSRTYRALSSVNKAKCVSITVELSFDPNEIVLDTTNSIRGLNTLNTQTVNGVSYISHISFPMEALTSSEIRFYKLDYTEDYTYPFGSVTPVVTFSAY